MLNELIHVIPHSKDMLYWSLGTRLWLVRGLPRHPLPSIPPFWPCWGTAGAHLSQGSVSTGFPGILRGKADTGVGRGMVCVRVCGWVWGSRVLRGGVGHSSNTSSKFRKSLAASKSGVSEMSVRVKPALPLGATLPHGPCSWFSRVPWWEEGFWGYCDLLLELLRFLPQLLHLPHGGRLKEWLFSLLPGTQGVCRGTPTFLFLTSHTMGGWSPLPTSGQDWVVCTASPASPSTSGVPGHPRVPRSPQPQRAEPGQPLLLGL